MTFYKAQSLFEILRIKSLYKKAFPMEERKPFSIIMKMARKGKTDIWYFEENGAFLGTAITINGESEILVDYFAVSEKKRGLGNGHKMLSSLVEHYQPNGVFLEIEIPYPDAENYSDRVRRKKFYLDLGFVPMGTEACLFGVDMELLGVGCRLDYEEYRDFYLKNYGRFAYDHITKPKGSPL